MSYEVDAPRENITFIDGFVRALQMGLGTPYYQTQQSVPTKFYFTLSYFYFIIDLTFNSTSFNHSFKQTASHLRAYTLMIRSVNRG